jgi:enterochelin esterase family protein
VGGAGTDGGASDAPREGGMEWPVGEPGTMGDGNFTIAPPFVIQPDLTDKGAPKGKSFHFTMPLAASLIFKGDDATLDPVKRQSNVVNRNIDVYVPALYQDGTPAAVLVIQDGRGPLDMVARALDNLTISKDPTRVLPPFVAVAVQNGGGDGKGSERGLEYDTMSDRYARFIELEVLPAVASDVNLRKAYPNFSFTANPEGRGALGCSSGSAAALTMGWFRPDLFRRLITYSGTFLDVQDDDAPEEKLFPMGAAEYQTGLMLIAKTPRKPLRVFNNANENEGQLVPNQRLAAALQAAGYHNRFVYAQGAGHCEGAVQQATLADALVWTWRGYPVK